TVPGTAPGTVPETAAGAPFGESPESLPEPADERARLARLAAVVVPGIDYEAMAGVPRRERDWVATARLAVAEARARLDWLDITRPERGLPPAPEAPPGLNARQTRFAEALARGASGAEAARLAGYAPGAAAVTASRMLRNDKVCSYFSALRDHNRLAERAEVDELVGHLRWSLARGRAAQDAGLVIRSVEAIARLKRYGLAHAPWRLAPEGPAAAAGGSGGDGRGEAGGG
ncbi:MAG: terminase small subunit, partial [Azospirillaceae bacterium]